MTNPMSNRLTILALLLGIPLSAQAGPAAQPLFGARPCTSGESWSFTGAIPEVRREEIRSSLRGTMAPVRAFSEALAMRRFASGNEMRFLGEYWISRALFDAKLPHIAFNGFASIASRPVRPETAGVQLSALGCMLEIQGRYPALALPASVVSNISAFRTHAHTPEMREVAWHGATVALSAQLAQKPVSSRKPASDPKVEAYVDALKGAGAYEDFAQALRAIRANDHSSAVTHLDRFLNAPSLPQPLKRFLNTGHVLMARELYSLQQFDRASMHLKQVSKGSNLLATALEELAWAQLMNDRLTESIGTAMNLQAGGLRHTYAPEALMVMAMALNELCQYPESVRAIHAFKKKYEKAYAWLAGHSGERLYPQAVKYVRRAPDAQVPDRVASEWVRSPLFISSQDELNLLFEEREATAALGKSGAREQSLLADAVLLKARDIPQRLRAAKAKMKEGDPLPSALKADMLALKDMILHYRRLQQGAPVWHTILASYKATARASERRLVATIEADLKERSQRMLAQLEEIAENIQLIEVEIYNGASQDIIWQNAHPDYKKVAQKLKEGHQRETGAKTWDWGRSPASLDDEGGEVWEDELGSFAANLYDNCSSKDKYLALKMGRVRE